MARPPLSDDTIAAFRARIAEEASRLFAAHGVEGVTMRAVAEALSISAMALYRYVADKDELLILLRMRAFRRFADHQACAFASRKDPQQRIAALGKAYVGYGLSEPEAYRVMFELRQPEREHTELSAEVERSFSYLRRSFEELAESGALSTDPLTAAHLAWASVHGLVSLHLAGKLGFGRDIDSLLCAFDAPDHESDTPTRRKR